MRVFPIAAALSLTLVTIAARADEAPEEKSFGERSTVILVVDDLIGYSRTKLKSDSSDSSPVETLGTNTQFIQLYGFATRFGVHFRVAPHFTIGTGLQYYHASEGTLDVRVLGFEPRLGVVIPLGPASSIWLRAGVGYQHWDHGSDYTESHVPGGGDIRYVHTSQSHFGWMIGPMVETDLSASASMPTSFGGTVTSKKRTTWGIGLGFLFDI